MNDILLFSILFAFGREAIYQFAAWFVFVACGFGVVGDCVCVCVRLVLCFPVTGQCVRLDIVRFAKSFR